MFFPVNPLSNVILVVIFKSLPSTGFKLGLLAFLSRKALHLLQLGREYSYRDNPIAASLMHDSILYFLVSVSLFQYSLKVSEELTLIQIGFSLCHSYKALYGHWLQHNFSRSLQDFTLHFHRSAALVSCSTCEMHTSMINSRRVIISRI